MVAKKSMIDAAKSMEGKTSVVDMVPKECRMSAAKESQVGPREGACVFHLIGYALIKLKSVAEEKS